MTPRDFDKQSWNLALFRNAGKPDDAVFSGEDPVEIISHAADFDRFPIERYSRRFAAAEFQEWIFPGQRYFQLRIERLPDLHILPESQFGLILSIQGRQQISISPVSGHAAFAPLHMAEKFPGDPLVFQREGNLFFQFLPGHQSELDAEHEITVNFLPAGDPGIGRVIDIRRRALHQWPVHGYAQHP